MIQQIKAVLSELAKYSMAWELEDLPNSQPVRDAIQALCKVAIPLVKYPSELEILQQSYSDNDRTLDLIYIKAMVMVFMKVNSITCQNQQSRVSLS